MSGTARSHWILPAGQPFFTGCPCFALFTLWCAKQLCVVLYWSIRSQLIVSFVIGVISESKPRSHGSWRRWDIRNGQGEPDLPDKDLTLAYPWSPESYKSYQSLWHSKSWLLGLPQRLEDNISLHALTSRDIFSSNFGPISINPFSVSISLHW